MANQHIQFTPGVIGIHNTPHLVKKSFDNLPFDKYSPNNDRLRRYAQFKVSLENDDVLAIQPLTNTVFSQKVTDNRSKPRKFEAIESSLLQSNWLSAFIAEIAGLSVICRSKENRSSSNMLVDVHQVRQLCFPHHPSDNAPEGIHRDGADYIVSAFVINRQNVSGGMSIIYNENKEEICRTVLESGEGIFMEDRKQWHDVTPVVSTNNRMGIRDIFGLDVTFQD